MTERPNQGDEMNETETAATKMRVFLQWGIFVSALGLCGCEPWPALTFEPPQYQLSQDDWAFRAHKGVHMTTDHFEIFTTIDDPVLCRFLPGFLETCHEFYASLVPAPGGLLEPNSRMKTYLLDDRSQWDAFVRDRYPTRYGLYRKITAGGFCEGDTCVIYYIGRAATLSVTAHEGLHQYLGSHFKQTIPAWLNEGLATYCEAVEFRRDKPYFTPQHNSFRIKHLRKALAEERILPLRELLSTNAGKVIDGNRVAETSTYYAQAWALIVYLRHGDKGRHRDGFDRMLADIGEGVLPIKARAAKAASPNPSGITYGEAVFLAYITEDFDGFQKPFDDFLMKLCWNR